MRLALVGHTGFVGGNLAASHPFDGCYNSKNISEAFGTRPELLVYAGMPAAKYLANTDPDGDWAVAENAFFNMERIAPQKLVLISTVDVYQTPRGCDEDTPADLDNPAAYGRNRARLERRVRERFPDALIVRLPGLFGPGLKKNFLYDLLTVTPAMLKADKYRELAEKSPLVAGSYCDADNGFYKLTAPSAALREWFFHNDFNALSFTDSRASYQFYDLTWLWADLCRALTRDLTVLNLATEPVTAAELYAFLTHSGVFKNELPGAPAAYDMRTRYGAQDGYLYTKQEVLAAAAAFVAAVRREERA